MDSITQQENKVLQAIVEAWDQFLKLPIEHPDDNNEFRIHIHALQNMIAARVGLRVYNTASKCGPNKVTF